MSIRDFSAELYSTGISVGIRSVDWLIPAVQSLHILAIAFLVGAAVVMELRMAGLLATDQEPHVVVRRYLPWLWVSLAFLLLTGLIMTIGEPNRVLANTTFWIKIFLIVVAFAISVICRLPFLRSGFALESASSRVFIKPLAFVSLIIWAIVIVCGRWIAYT